MRNKKGLTLLELILVMLIIAIIAGIGTPVFTYAYRQFFEITTNYRMQGEMLTVFRDLQGRLRKGAELISVTADTIVWKELVTVSNPPQPSDFTTDANFATRKIYWDKINHTLGYYANAGSGTPTAIISNVLRDETIDGVLYPGIKFERVIVPGQALNNISNTIKVQITCSAPIAPGREDKRQTVYGVTYLTLLGRSAQ